MTPEQQLKDLREAVRILSLENEILAERAEDTALLGLIGEKINYLEDPRAVIETGLEQISLLKDIPLCACCSTSEGQIRVESSYVSFSDAPLEGISLTLPKEFAASRSVVLSDAALRAAGLTIALPGLQYKPASLLLIAYERAHCPCGVFVFAADSDNGQLDRCQDMLMRVVEMLISRINTLHLLRELGEAKEDLDYKIGERTRELSEAYRGLEQGMAERLASQEALKESEDKFRTIFNNAIDGMLIADLETKQFTASNKMIQTMLGYDEKEMRKLGVLDIHPEKDLPYVLKQFEKQARKEIVVAVEIPIKRRDGTRFFAEVSASPITISGKEYLLGIFRDNTEHRKLEDQLRQSQKMESIGTLAGGIAHDFNNILTAIIGYGHLTLRKLEKDDPNRLNIEQILEAADRAAHLTKDLLLFSRKQVIDRKLVDLNSIIRRLEKFLIRVIGEDISFQTILREADLPILADAHQIEQVLMNLATNARDAMPRGGTLTIATDQIRLDEQFVRLYGYCRPGMYAQVTVSDTGQGMDHATAQRIFEPFFTTKEVGRGTGLGLAVVYGIVRQHEGHINAYSEPGAGTTFRIYLPVAVSDGDEEQVPAVKEDPVGGTETILLAEDNDAVRDLTISILTEFGYTVITAVDGEDAVNKYRENAESIQMLLFDLIMPGKSGKEAYDEIRKITPDIKILFASGYSPDIIRDKASLGNGMAIIFKPVSPMELLKKVRSVLNKGKD